MKKFELTPIKRPASPQSDEDSDFDVYNCPHPETTESSCKRYNRLHNNSIILLKFDDCVEYYKNDKELPILSRVKTGYMAEQLIKLIINASDVTPSHICKTQPRGVSENATFLIDLEIL